MRTAGEVLAHLARRLPAYRVAASPARLSGGHLNYVWRVAAEPRALIVKWAPPFAAAQPAVPLDPGRILIEAASLELLGPGGRLEALCTGALRAPARIDLDTERHVLVMEDLGTLPDLGRLLKTGCVPAGTGRALGRFIGELHARTEGDAALAAAFDNAAVQEARLDVQYRAIGSMLSQAGIAAPPAAARRAARLGERLTGAGRCLIMGDLWPDSVLVQGRRLRLIDWELAHFGQPAQDVGHLLAHLWMHAHRGAAQGVPLARSFLEHYVDALGDRARSFADDRFRADCAVHEGAEIIARCLGPFRQGYAGLPAAGAPVREAVAFAIDCIMAGDDPLLAAALT